MSKVSVQVCVLTATIATVLLVSTFVAPVTSKSVMIKRNANYCDDTTPCGWYVYKKESRKLDYFIKSPCECLPTYKCVRDTDDLSISSFVHRCRLDSYLNDDRS